MLKLRTVMALVTAGIAWTVITPPMVANVSRFTRPPTPSHVLPGPVDEVWLEPVDRNYSYGPALAERDLRAAGAQLASIAVTYDAGFAANPQAQAAFQAAVNIWSTVLSSPIPIRVTARFIDLGNPSLLGSAGPTFFCTSAAGQANTFYSNALADKLAGADACAPGQPEINASFNSAVTDWEFGVSGTPVAGKVSFMTIVLHELGHGLGFYGSMSVSSGVGSWGELPGVPDIYDRFAFTGGGQALLSLVSPSLALGAQLVGGSIFFIGPNARGANGGAFPKLESSLNPFREGSSYSHVDDLLYSGTPNGLMTWQLARAEVYTDPGPIVRGIFADEGWAGGGAVGAPGPPSGLTTSASGSNVTLGWIAPTTGGAPTGYLIEAGSSTGLANLASFPTGTTATSFATGGVPAGTYIVRVKATNAAGTSAPSNESTLVVGGGCTTAPSAPLGLFIVSNSGGTVSLAWTASAGSPTTYIVEAGSSSGSSNLANLDLGSSVPGLTTPAPRGLYFVRVRGRNACGTSAPSNEIIVNVL
jgi:hypothetical protein